MLLGAQHIEYLWSAGHALDSALGLAPASSSSWRMLACPPSAAKTRGLCPLSSPSGRAPGTAGIDSYGVRISQAATCTRVPKARLVAAGLRQPRRLRLHTLRGGQILVLPSSCNCNVLSLRSARLLPDPLIVKVLGSIHAIKDFVSASCVVKHRSTCCEGLLYMDPYAVIVSPLHFQPEQCTQTY